MSILDRAKTGTAYVVMLKTYSGTDGRLIGALPVAIWFDYASAVAFCQENTEYFEWEVVKTIVPGIDALERELAKKLEEVEDG